MLKIAKGVNPSRFNYFLQSRNKSFRIEVSNVAYGTCMQWRGRSYAASVPSEPPAEKSRKRISKDERKSMVEAYINEYRASHDGKFPSVSDARKNVGGSFYIIRKIVQELEYRSKASSAGTGTGSSPFRRSNKEIKISEDVEIRTEFHEIAANDRHLEAAKVESLASSATTDKHLQAAKVESLASSATERILFEETEKPRTLDGQADPTTSQGNLMKETSEDYSGSYLRETEDRKPKELQETHMENITTGGRIHQSQERVNDGDKRDKSLCFNEVESGAAKHEVVQLKGSIKPEKSSIDTYSRETGDAKSSTLWGNLKSLADEFMRMLRKH